MLILLTACGVFAFAAAFLAVAGLRRWAGSRLLDIPNARSSHVRPTPRGGGLAIVMVVLAGSWLILSFAHSGVTVWQWLVYSVGALLVAGVSWLDDWRSLSTCVRFAAHLIGAILVCLAFGAWQEIAIPGIGYFNFGLWGWPLTLVWIVGLTNAYNFMDGIDGIAGAQAVIAGLAWTILGIIVQQPFLGAVGILLAASSIGFLGHNWPPAKIFMGDVGSAFLGYTFAVLPLMAACGNTTCGDTVRSDTARADPRFALIGLLFVWPFVFDTTFTFLRRLRKRENVFAAHRSHLYQRLVISGLSHQTVTLLYAGLALVGALMGVACIMNVCHIGIFILTGLTMPAFGLWALTFWRERFKGGGAFL